MTNMALNQVFELYDNLGGALYGGERISQTEHALQCAFLAEQAGEAIDVVLAALLHDYGHFLPPASQSGDDLHHDRGAAALGHLFGSRITEIIRLHVAAKRYLCASEPGYWQSLSDISQISLTKQGGPFGAAEMANFAALPAAAAAIRVRRFDDQAKIIGAETPTLGHYRQIAEKISLERPGI